ncbi:MAG TPA: ATP-binding protein [Anaeromyxobacteraceae bacterium]|nr:ATP-binding protein [Anaeromyxobacteraceae bacterium]
MVAATVFDVSAVANAARTAETARSAAKLEALQEAHRKKDEFLGMLSHELRNPLAPIQNSVYILERVDQAGEHARRAREVLRRQVAHLSRIVDDLLDVTRIERGKFEIRHCDVDLVGLVRRTAEDYRGVFEQRGIALHLEAPAHSVRVVGDDARLAQAVGNLLHNSARFTGESGRVTLSLSAVGNDAEIRVRDTGAEMQADLVRHVFEPYTQGHQTLARTAGGLGLGLALVKAVVELHGGTVHASSGGEGCGSEFVIRVPLGAATVSAAHEPPAPARASRGRRVLVVEDNVDAATSLVDLLTMFGHAVEVAHDGPTAVRMTRANRPDIVLCDIGLPGMSGYEVAKALRAMGSNGMQLVAVSGYAQVEDVERAAEAGFERHVAKPCDPDEIKRLLE